MDGFSSFIKNNYQKVKEEEKMKEMKEAYNNFKNSNLYYNSQKNVLK